MLTNLQIENIAIIEKASIDFVNGLNIFTGETGAGKSIIIDSINAVIGEKTSRELIRSGAQSANVTAFFTDISQHVTDMLNDSGIPCEDDNTLLIQRRIFRDGKNSCRINGMTVTVSMLKAIGFSLINIHGQKDSQALLDSARHIDFLDSFADSSALLTSYRESYHRLKDILSKINSLKTDEAYKARRTDLLTFQISELENAAVVPGEIKELNRKKNVLRNSAKLKEALRSAENALSGDGDNGGAGALISNAVGEINSVCSLSKDLSIIASSLENASGIIDDASAVISDVLYQLDGIDGDIDSIEERLDLLYRLSKKYGSSEEEMLSFLENARAELDDITLSDEKITALTAEYEKELVRAGKYAQALSDHRKNAGKTLSGLIENELHFLNMPSAVFFVGFREKPMSEDGTDETEFLISANPGEEPKPLVKVASGGELSRVMLALKNVLNEKGSADTLIFDEIDTGVSGAAAGKIAVKLSQVSAHFQVLCITHLSQIAAFADRHMFLSKQVNESKTFTHVEVLSDEERAGELARINFGENVSSLQLLSAEKMLSDAAEAKKKNGVS